MKEPAHVAYDGYRQFLIESLGQPLPRWSELPETIRAAWRAGVGALAATTEQKPAAGKGGAVEE